MNTKPASLYHKEYAGGANPGGPPLVLVHGAGGDLMHWPANLRRLPGHRVYALDLPGHGKSAGVGFTAVADYAEAVRRWADDLGLPKFVLAGHSMGGAVAVEYALRHPGGLAGLVLVSTGARLRVAPQLLAGVLNDRDGTVDLLVRWMYGDWADPNLLRLGARRLREVPPEVLHADFVACDTFDRRADVARIELPTLIVCGSADVMTPLKLSQSLHDQIAGSELVILPDAGHMAAIQQPEPVGAAVQAFLERLR